MTRFWSPEMPGALLCEECLDVVPEGITLVEVFDVKARAWAYLKACTHA